MTKLERYPGAPKAGTYYTWESKKRSKKICKQCKAEYLGVAESKFCGLPCRHAWHREHRK